jgi:ABC-type dipeptide/oligopeptide/nickel transport system permease subunit
MLRGPRPWIALVLGLALLCGCAPWLLTGVDPYAQHLLLRLRPPIWLPRGVSGHLLGTDQLGRDLLARIIYGAQMTLLISVSAVVVSTLVGGLAGIAAGFYGRAVDAVIMRLIDIQLAFPVVLLVLAVVAVVGSSLTNLIIVMGLSGWPQFARMVRGSVRSVRQMEFVEAAHSLGATNARLILRHVLPNIAGTVLVYMSAELGRLILVEATLGFLGLGVQPPTPTWGGMISEGSQYLAISWAPSLLPGIAIVALVMAVSGLGEELRRILARR